MTFDDPVLRKELSGLSRRWQTYFVRVLYVGLIGLIVWRFWDGMTRQGALLEVSEAAALGRELFISFVVLQMIFVTVAVTVAATEAVSREIRSGTLGLLVITPLSGWRVASGKWKASMAHALALVLAGMPVLAISVYLGGVGPLEAAWGTFLTLSLAAVAAGFAILHVATFPTRHNALIGALFTMFLYALAPTVFAIMGGPGMTLAAFLSPPHAAIAAAIAHKDPAWGDWYRWGWIGATLTSLLTAHRLLQASAGHLSRWTPEGSGLVPAMPAPPPPARPTRPVSDRRPLLWKELALRDAAWGGGDRKAYVLTGMAALAALCWLPCQGREMGPFLFLGFVFTFLAVLNGSSLFLQEKDVRAWDTLLSTPLPRSEIVKAKLLAGLTAIESRAGLLIALVCVAGWGLPAGLGAFFLVLAVSAPFLLFAYLLGAAAALRTRTMRGAFALSGGIMIVLLFVLPWLTRAVVPGQDSFLVEGIGGSLHPATFLRLLERSEDPMSRGSLADAFPMLCLYVLAYAAACAGLVTGLVRGVNRLGSRTV
jgi:ABC-type transport system involved in multi-copper enzyme maturation permease subunit